MTEELRDKARTLGLDRLTDEHLKQFERATTGMERHLQRLPRGMLTAQEPAHVYPGEGGYAMSGDLAYLGLAEAAELIRAKKLSPVECM